MPFTSKSESPEPTKKPYRMADMPIGKQALDRENKRAIAKPDETYQPLFKALTKQVPIESKYK